MKLTALNIKSQEFSKSMRGYDVEEVHAFLDKLGDEVQTVVNENKKLKEEVESFKQKADDVQRLEKELQETLTKAHDTSAKLIESAKQESHIIIKEAELKASLILENSNQKIAELRLAIENLRQEKNLFISKLRAIVISQANLLEGKLREAGEEPGFEKQSRKSEDVKIDVDDIVNKIL